MSIGGSESNINNIVDAIAKMDNKELQQFAKAAVQNGCATQLEFHLHNEQLMFDLDIQDEEE
jgi:hypothetical protein